MDKTISKIKNSVSLVDGGLVYSVSLLLKYISKPEKLKRNLSISLVLITWFVLGTISLIEGNLSNNNLTISFLNDFQLHVRFLLIIPFLILIEKSVDKAFVDFVHNTENIVPPEQKKEFDKLFKRLDRIVKSNVPELIMLLICFAISIFMWENLSVMNIGNSYLFESGKLNLAGYYYIIVCSPIFQLLVFRWFYRWILWFYLMLKISRFKIVVDALHGDNMAGLEYLNLVPLAISFLLIALSAAFSAHIGMEIIYNNAMITDYVLSIVTYVFLLPVILYSPLLFFSSQLISAKSYGITYFGDLIRQHNIAYRNAWIDKTSKKDEALLGTMDNSSLADINGSYLPIKNMKLFPINPKILALSFVLNIIPYIPLVFTFYTFSDLLNLMLKSVV